MNYIGGGAGMATKATAKKPSVMQARDDYRRLLAEKQRTDTLLDKARKTYADAMLENLGYKGKIVEGKEYDFKKTHRIRVDEVAVCLPYRDGQDERIMLNGKRVRVDGSAGRSASVDIAYGVEVIPE